MHDRIGFIGGGNMAGALLGGMAAHAGAAAAPVVVEPDAAARVLLAARFGAECHAEAGAALQDCGLIVLAVKPQQMQAAVRSIAPFIATPLVISIAAGVRTDSILAWLGRAVPLVRAMPNTPALIGRGITGLYPCPGVSSAERRNAEEILQAVGVTVWVEREADLDAVTAVSGSGPAYVYYFIEALESAAIELGLPAALARQLALSTFAGASELALAAAESPAVLRERVTSKGGTTAAALAVFEAARVDGVIGAAVRAAAARSRELGDASAASDGSGAAAPLQPKA